MSEEERICFEKAMARLAESSAQHDERLAEHKERLAAIERTNEILKALAADAHQLLANMQRRVAGLEESYVTMTKLLESRHEGVAEMRAAQANADAKIAALADAQIRTEAALERGNERVQNALTRLAESQAHTDQRLDALIDIVRGSRNGESDG